MQYFQPLNNSRSVQLPGVHELCWIHMLGKGRIKHPEVYSVLIFLLVLVIYLMDTFSGILALSLYSHALLGICHSQFLLHLVSSFITQTMRRRKVEMYLKRTFLVNVIEILYGFDLSSTLLLFLVFSFMITSQEGVQHFQTQ